MIIAAFFCSTSCERTEVKPANTSIMQKTNAPALSPIPPKDGNYTSKGKVTKINTDLGSVELNHEEVIGLMPAMQMEFYVKDKSLLDGLKVGDIVEFVLEYKHPSETIVGIKKIQ